MFQIIVAGCFARRGVKEGEGRSNNNNYYYVYTLANMNNTTKRTRCPPYS